MTAITALNVRLGMDASNFSQGADLARAEVNRVASVLRQSVPPAEKFKKELELLDRAFSATGKQSKEYANALDFLKKKHGQTSPVVNKAGQSIDQLKQSMLSAVPGGSMLANALKGPQGVALALAAALAIVTRGMMEAATQIDKTAKAARSLGTTYRDLVALQMLASESAGIDSSQINKALGGFTRRLAEARVNGGKLAEDMKALGLDVAKLAAMDPADAFRQISDVIKNIPDEAEQIRVATMLVGKEAVKMIEVFRGGSAAIDEAAKQAERLGLIIGEDAARSIETMNDAFGRVGMSVDGIWNSLLTQLAPTLTNIARLAEEFFVLFRQASEAASDVSKVVQVILPLINKIIEGFRFVIALITDTVSLVASIPGHLLGVGKIANKMEATNRFLNEMDAKAKGVSTSTQAASEAAEALAIETERAADAARKQEETFKNRLRDLTIESVALAGNTEEAERMRLIAEGYSKTQADNIIALKRQNALIKERVDAEKKAAEEATKAAEAKANQDQKTADKQKADAKEKKRLIEEMNRAFTSEVQSAMKAVEAYFAQEKQRDDERRQQVSAGPGAGIEVGSAEAAKFRADHINRAIGAAAVPERPTPGEKEIADKTRKLLVEQRRNNKKQDQQLDVMKKWLTTFENTRPLRIR